MAILQELSSVNEIKATGNLGWLAMLGGEGDFSLNILIVLIVMLR
jgi:hypothetical protein